VPDGDQEAVSDGDQRAFLAAACGQTTISGLQVRVLGASCRGCRFTEGAAQPRVAVAGGATVVFAGRFVVARTMPAQEARCLAVGKRAMLVPISARMTWA